MGRPRGIDIFGKLEYHITLKSSTNYKPKQMENSQLQNLMSYTIFHIGAYITLLGIIIGFANKSLNENFFKVPFLCYLIAGICGGIIASNIPEYSSFNEFANSKIGFWIFNVFKYKTWAFVEHLTFWIGTLWIALTFIFRGSKPLLKKVRS